MRAEDKQWAEYIDSEVRAVCERRCWGHRIRRKDSVRNKPVRESPIEDYEWKIILDAPELPGGHDDVYYIVSFDRPGDRFILQHDTCHIGCWGPHWEVSTYTEIRPSPWEGPVPEAGRRARAGLPPAGWLRDHLERLVRQFGPNEYCIT